MFKNALISVTDKTGLSDFLNKAVTDKSRLVSTGGTSKILKDKGFNITDVEEWTGHPEVMNGRVKTLHPRIHMCLLARDKDEQLLSDYKLQAFDLVIGNLYKFSEKPSIESIDIGGPSFLRAAAKNYEKIIVLCDPADYDWVLEKKLKLTSEERKYLAAKVFRHTSVYDSNIANWFEVDAKVKKPSQWSWGGNVSEQLRYGENPQQESFLVAPQNTKGSFLEAELIQGKKLSYNNILDLAAAVKTLQLFEDQPTVVAVKHNNPCGVACSESLELATQKALAADPKSVFGGIVAISGKINQKIALQLSELFLECIIAPSMDAAAKEIFSKKANLRVLIWPEIFNHQSNIEFRSVLGACLVQNSDRVAPVWDNKWQIFGEEPTESIKQELLFAWKICSALKSNAIAVSRSLQSTGLGMGQVNRVDAVAQALQRSRDFHQIDSKSVLASDAFFPFEDSIERVFEAGVRWIIQPGGSLRDELIKAKAKQLGVNMVFTGQRHFNH